MRLAELMLSLTGLISAIVVPIMLYVSWKRNRFNIRRNTLSDCGSIKNSAGLFNLTLAVFGVLQVAFAYALTVRFIGSGALMVLAPPIFAGAFVLVAALLDNKKHNKLHVSVAFAALIILIIWSFLFHYLIFQANAIAGCVGFMISLGLALGTGITFLRIGLSAVPELVFLSLVFIWDIFFTYAIFFMG